MVSRLLNILFTGTQTTTAGGGFTMQEQFLYFSIISIFSQNCLSPHCIQLESEDLL